MQAVSFSKLLVRRGLQSPHPWSKAHVAAPAVGLLRLDDVQSSHQFQFSSIKRYLTSRSQPALKSSPTVDSVTGSSSGIPTSAVQVPQYLKDTYTWAYLHPNAVWFFERQWLVNAILWGNYPMLRDAVIDDLCSSDGSGNLRGDTLQIACAYGDLTQCLARRIDGGDSTDDQQAATLNVVDVAPIQLENLHNKLKETNQDSLVTLTQQNANDLDQFESNSMDQVLFFFLLHEIPLEVRTKAVEEAFRVCKPGGRVYFVDYHQPSSLFNPWRYLMRGVLTTLEPFALDLWRHEISEWIPDHVDTNEIEKKTYFGGLYQKVIVEKR